MNNTLRWWLQVAQVRLRFIGVVLVAGVIVSQWPLIRSVWDRWTWSSHQHSSSGVSSSLEYFCPMDPGQISVWPAICPICNMDLVPRKKMEAQILPEGVIARMQFSPYRIQLAGIRTDAVVSGPLTRVMKYSGIVQMLTDDSLGFRITVPEADASLFSAEQPAEVRARVGAATYSATVRRPEQAKPTELEARLDNPADVASGTAVTVVVQLPVANDVLAIPESAVIDRGHEQMVFIESMPGMFDGVKVRLGERCGDKYPVLEGLKADQRVASAGAFLIDAESKLNPSVAAGYFGANQSRASGSSPPSSDPVIPKPSQKKSSPSKQKLSREDQALADKQGTCPVTDLPLDSMGGPVPILVAGRKVFICCGGCEKKLKNESEKYLAKLNQPKSD